MKTSTAISNTDNVIDSRDVIARIEGLEGSLEGYHSDWFEKDSDLWKEWLDDPDTDASNEPPKPPDLDEWIVSVSGDSQHDMHDEAVELLSLKRLADELEGYGDWAHGEMLIRESYFTDYAQELAEDVGAIPRDAPWPACHIDWEAAADSLKADYTEADFDGVTYLMRA